MEKWTCSPLSILIDPGHEVLTGGSTLVAVNLDEGNPSHSSPEYRVKITPRPIVLDRLDE